MVAVAPGKVIPSGRIKTIQPFETGVVRALYVEEGQRVSAGAPLIDLDPTINAAEQNHFKADLMAAELDIARLRAELASPADPLSSYTPPPSAAPYLLAAQRHYLLIQSEERRAKIAASTGKKRKRRRRPPRAKRRSPSLRPPSPCSCRRPRFTGL